MISRPTIPITALALTAPCVLAQPTPDPIDVDEVVVTTGFRPARLSDAIGSTTVVGADEIESRGAEHLESVIATVPNVTMTSGASRGRFVQVRGVGDLEQFVDPKHYPSVGVSIDGIDVGGLASAAMLFDVRQVEVLRGPQGTRFGAGALAGQVNIVSPAPDASDGNYLDAGLGDFGTAMLGAAVGGVLSDTLSGRIAVQHHRGDGYIENAWLGRDDTNGYEESMVRGRLRFAAGDSARYDFTALLLDADNGYDAFSLDNTRTTLSDEPGHDDLALAAIGVTGRFDLAQSGSIEATLNWIDSTVDYGFDEDWTYAGICDGTLCDPVFDFFSNTDRYRRERDDRSLDLRWLGGRDDGAGPRFVAGLYVQDRRENLAREYYGPFSSAYSTDRIAIYGQAEWPLTDRLTLTTGLRHETFEDRYSDSFAFTSATDDELTSGELALRVDLATATLYALVAKGSKPGGVNTEASSVVPFVQPRFQDFLSPRLRFSGEDLVNTEIGFTTELAGGRGTLRAALFVMQRDAAQLESWFWDPVNFLWVGVLDNSDGDNVGTEIELDYAVTSRWHLRASLGLIDTDIDRLTSFDLNVDDFVTRDGIDQAKAPDWQAHIGSRWELAAGWRLAVDLDSRASHRYGYYHDARIGRATLLHASVARAFGANEVTLWARNLTDERYDVHGLYFGNDPRKGWVPEQYLQPGEPRLVGVTVRHAF